MRIARADPRIVLATAELVEIETALHAKAFELACLYAEAEATVRRARQS
jgi:hypothetical protein